MHPLPPAAPAEAPVRAPRGAHTRILGVRVDALTLAGLLSRVVTLARSSGPHLVCYVNADCLNLAARDRRYRAILQGAEVVYADGMGVVWASRLTERPLPERITLGECLPDLCRIAEAEGLRLFFLGGLPGVARRAAARLRREFPRLAIVGTHHGYSASAEEDEAVLAQIRAARPHLVLVGLGAPRQEKWMWQHREDLDVPVLWGVGGLFDYYAGRVPRAPVWVGRAGFEWLFRLWLEPGRLWRRYVLGNAYFILRAGSLLLADGLVVGAAWLGAYAVRFHLTPVFGFEVNPPDPYIRLLPLMVAIWLVICAGLGLYRRSSSLPVVRDLAQVAQATMLGLLLTISAAFLLREFDVARSVVLVAAALTFGCLALTRLTVRALERRAEPGLRRALIVGRGALARRLGQEIERWPAGYEVVGVVDHAAGRSTAPADDLLASLGRRIRQERIHDVFIASPEDTLHEALNLLAAHEGWPVNVHIVSPALESFARRVPLDRAVEWPLLRLPPHRIRPWYEAAKRAADIAVGACGLVLCLPVFAVIAAAVKMESPGPVMFAQQRVGRGGRHFTMYKFRTMQTDADVYAVAPNDVHDPRVTRCGRVLRRLSLDELPQLANILRGDMSLVGPRPEMPFLVERYEPWQRRRLAVRPGLTCLWQVVGRKELPLHSHLEYDLYYLRHRGWMLDLLILLRTVPAVLQRRGAF